MVHSRRLALLVITLALASLACGARSAARAGWSDDDAGRVPADLARADRVAPSPLRDGGGVPDRAPELPPAGWQELAVGTRGVIEDLRGVSDGELWMAGHLPGAGQGACWVRDGSGFRVELLPTPFPVQGVWGRAATDLWAAGRRDHPKDSALWHRDASGSWSSEPLASPPTMDLLSIDGAGDGELVTVGRAGKIGVALHRSAKGVWSEQLFSDAFQWMEARDVLVLGPGDAYAVGQRSSRARFWFTKSGVWLLDQGLNGEAWSIGAAGPRGADTAPVIYAGGSTLWRRNAQSDWLAVPDAPKPAGSIRRVRGNDSGLWLIDAMGLWGRREGESWRSASLPGGERPRALWVSPSWIWVAAQSGRLFRQHVLSF